MKQQDKTIRGNSVKDFVRDPGRDIVKSIPVDVGNGQHAAEAIAVSGSHQLVFAEIEPMVDRNVVPPGGD